MQIVTVCFDYDDRPEFAKLLEVFRYSVKKHMPDSDYIEYRDKPPEYDGRNHGYLDNTFKLKIWAEHMAGTKENTIFIDCDMMALRNAKHAFYEKFDIAYTACPDGYMVPLNGGVIFAKPTELAREFFSRLRTINDKMYHDYEFHKPWQDKYHGMNQSAMGYILENMCHDINIKKYMTREWNAIECDWRMINDSTVFCHINKQLRRNVLARKYPAGALSKPMAMWYKYVDEINQEIETDANTINGRDIAGAVTSEMGA